MPVFDFSDRYIKFFESRVQFLLTTAPKSQKFLFLHLFGIGKPKRTLFLRKNFEKGQKNLPAGSGEQGILAFLLFEYQRKNF